MPQVNFPLWECWFNTNKSKAGARYYRAVSKEAAIQIFLSDVNSCLPENTVACSQVLPEDLEVQGAQYIFVYKIPGTLKEETILAYSLANAIGKIEKTHKTIGVSGIIIKQLLQEDKSPVFE